MIPNFVMIAVLAVGGDQPASGLPELCTVPGPYFRIPCKVDALKDVECVQLYVSDNRGEKWALYSQCSPDQPWFTFRAKQPGEYWFTARLKMKDGTLNPPNLADFVPMQRVAVTNGTEPADTPMTLRKGESTLAAAATELDDELVRLELNLIRKEIKRLTEEASLTPDVEQKIDRLRARLTEVRNRINRDQKTPFGQAPGFFIPGPVPTPIPVPDVPSPVPTPSRRPADLNNELIPPTALPTSSPGILKSPARPVAPRPHVPAPR